MELNIWSKRSFDGKVREEGSSFVPYILLHFGYFSKSCISVLLVRLNIKLEAVLKTDQLAGDWWGIPNLTREPMRSIGMISAEETGKGRLGRWRKSFKATKLNKKCKKWSDVIKIIFMNNSTRNCNLIAHFIPVV